MKNYITYYRVSTRKQGDSGLGLEGQRVAVERFTHDGEVIAEFTEVESGSKTDRPQLKLALEAAKKNQATLVVAKLDRLSRNVRFTADLLDSGVDFIACDNPHANRMTIQLLAVFAEQELRMISQRTKAGLEAAKSRGVKLGAASPKYSRVYMAGEKRAKRTKPYPVQMTNIITQMRSDGVSFAKVADTLNKQGWESRSGSPFNAKTVHRIVGEINDV